LVILNICLNDVINRRDHWNYTWTAITNIPPESIPNLEHDRIWNQRMLALRESRWAILRSLGCRFRRYGIEKARSVKVSGREWPVYLGEDTTDIRVLVDVKSPEWAWLTKWIRKLIK